MLCRRPIESKQVDETTEACLQVRSQEAYVTQERYGIHNIAMNVVLIGHTLTRSRYIVANISDYILRSFLITYCLAMAPKYVGQAGRQKKQIRCSRI